MADELLLTAARLCTFLGTRLLTNASSFFFARGERLFLVTSRHVVSDRATEHYPDRIEIELHVDLDNLARSTGFSIPLYRNRKSIWRQGRDGGSEVDVAVIEIERAALPPAALYSAFTPAHLPTFEDAVEIGASLLVVGFPLGFHDTLHHMPVVRQAAVASAYGLRFQGQGYFLTDARTHRGTSGAPVVMRADAARGMGLDAQRLAPRGTPREMSLDAQRDTPHSASHAAAHGAMNDTAHDTPSAARPAARFGASYSPRDAVQRAQSEAQPGVPFHMERGAGSQAGGNADHAAGGETGSRTSGVTGRDTGGNTIGGTSNGTSNGTSGNTSHNPGRDAGSSPGGSFTGGSAGTTSSNGSNRAANDASSTLAQRAPGGRGTAAAPRPLPWLLLGVHSSRLDVGSRDINLDEALGLNCAWYADILLKLTEA